MTHMRHEVYRSLTDPILFMKVPYQFFIILAFVVLIIIVLTSFVILPLILAVVLYAFAVAFTKHDPRWLEILTISASKHGVDFSSKGKRYVV